MEASFEGAAPVVTVRPIEREIYRQMWARPEYRAVAPGEQCASLFMAQARPKKGATVLDMGCGTGRGALSLAFFGGLNVTMLDFADNCLDDDIRPMLETQAHALRFVQADLTKPLPASAEYGYCTDVLEHIPPAQVDAVLDNTLKAAQHVFYQISTVDDVCGALIGHALHLSVHPYEWWLKKFNERGCLVHWSHNDPAGQFCCFYVTAWATGEDVVDVGILNVPEEQVKANVRANLARGFAQATPHESNDFEVMILGGGPSLDAHLEEIRALRADGVKLIALNGAHDWCLDNGLTPSAMIMVDAREFNARFTRRPVSACRYLLASQCHPSVFDGIPPEQVVLWHTTAEMIREELDAADPVWFGIPGGSTVLLRAIPLLRMLGYCKFHLFGCDSCLQGEQHHAYAQPENDDPLAIPVTVGGRVFHCHAWMLSQAQEFQDLIRYLGEAFELEVHGDGLLAHILNVGADLQDAQPVVTAVSETTDA
jgi:hypothetical protein